MTVIKKYTLTKNFKQLIDLNEDSLNFACNFSVNSENNIPFYIAVVDQQTLDNNSFKFKYVSSGNIGGNIKQNDNIYQNYYLVLKTEEDNCEVEINIDKKIIPPSTDIQKQQIQKQKLYESQQIQKQKSHESQQIQKQKQNLQRITQEQIRIKNIQEKEQKQINEKYQQIQKQQQQLNTEKQKQEYEKQQRESKNNQNNKFNWKKITLIIGICLFIFVLYIIFVNPFDKKSISNTENNFSSPINNSNNNTSTKIPLIDEKLLQKLNSIHL